MPKYVDVENAGVGLCKPEIFTDPQYGEGWNAAIHYFMEIAPAADVEEVEHGDWVEYTNRDGQMACYCSACGSDPGVLYLYRRCPECGAHMSRKLTKEKDSE